MVSLPCEQLEGVRACLRVLPEQQGRVPATLIPRRSEASETSCHSGNLSRPGCHSTRDPSDRTNPQTRVFLN